MLRPDGYVKVLDFGIAKLAEQRVPVAITEEEPAGPGLHTRLGRSSELFATCRRNRRAANRSISRLTSGVWGPSSMRCSLGARRLPVTARPKSYKPF